MKNTAPENYLSLLPEIAALLNISVSSVRQYPTDIQKILCEVYINNYHSDEISIKQALGQIVQLNTETEKQIEQAQAVPKSQEQKKRLSAQKILSREQLLHNAKIIAEKNRKSNSQNQEEQLNKNGGQ